MKTNEWISVLEQLPPHGEVVMTKIDRGGLVTNEQKLVRINRLFFFEDRSMYVYYTPTHWQPLRQEQTPQRSIQE